MPSLSLNKQRFVEVSNYPSFFLKSKLSELLEIKLFGATYHLLGNTKKIGVDGRIYAHRENFNNHVSNLLNSVMPERPILIDIGCNTGFQSCWFLHHYHAPVIAIEAHPIISHITEINLAKQFFSLNQSEITLSDCIVLNKAVSDSQATIYLKVGEDYGSSHLDIQKNGQKLNQRSVYEVKCLSLDDVTDILTTRFPERQPIVKMDIEGHEINALNSGLVFIKKYKPPIVFEWLNLHQKRNSEFFSTQNKAGAIFNQMQHLGYRFYHDQLGEISFSSFAEIPDGDILATAAE